MPKCICKFLPSGQLKLDTACPQHGPPLGTLISGKEQMDEMHKDRPFIREDVVNTPKFTIEEIKHYLEGLCLVGDHKENDMLNCAISLLDDHEDGIEAVLERRRLSVTKGYINIENVIGKRKPLADCECAGCVTQRIHPR